MAREAAPPESSERQRTLITFADHLTRSPQTFTPSDTDAIRGVLPNEGEVVEAATVVAGFNFANRVADALDVPLETPRILCRRRFTHHVAMRVMSFGIRLRMNFSSRHIPSPTPEEVLRNLRDATAAEGMGRIPSYFEKLAVRPHILAGQAAICINLLREPGCPRKTVQRIGYLISLLNADWECALEFLRADPAFLPMTLEDEILAFARDITLRADRIIDAQVESLRNGGLSERQILNLTLLCASYNAGNRLNRALSWASSRSVPPVAVELLSASRSCT